MANYTRYALTDKGKEAFGRIAEMHEEEIRLQESTVGVQNTEYGWSCIDDDDHIKTLDDEVDLMIYVYDKDAIDTIADWIRDGLDDYGHGYTCKQVISRISERGLLEVVK